MLDARDLEGLDEMAKSYEDDVAERSFGAYPDFYRESLEMQSMQIMLQAKTLQVLIRLVQALDTDPKSVPHRSGCGCVACRPDLHLSPPPRRKGHVFGKLTLSCPVCTALFRAEATDGSVKCEKCGDQVKLRNCRRVVSDGVLGFPLGSEEGWRMGDTGWWHQAREADVVREATKP